jgi:DNA repair exonuclease SbcCD ATPase subunit
MTENSPLKAPQSFIEQLESVSSPSEALRLCIDEMRLLLSQREVPNFRAFWEVRQKCLTLFKEKVSPRTRTLIWSEFISLSEEFRKVKGVINSQAAFAVEQIELAIEALKADIEQIDHKISEMTPIDFPNRVRIMDGQQDHFIPIQQELDLMSNFAGRLNSLRRELLNTPMRARIKSRLFNKLSQLGDSIFPRQKEKISLLSESFLERIHTFSIDESSLHDSKEEIKALQALSKALMINTRAFNQIREILSSFWDQIREQEREHHEKKAQDREKFKESFEALQPKIQLLNTEGRQSKITWKKAQEREVTILAEMRKFPLGPADFKALKKQLAEAIEPLEKKRIEELKKRKEKELQALAQRQKAQDMLMNSLTELLDRSETLGLDVLVEKWESLVKEEKTLDPKGPEGEKISRRLDAICDHIQEKKWQSLQEDQSEEGKHQLHALLDNRHKARRKLKKALEDLRKIVGGSGLNLEGSLFYQEMIREEKYRLDAIETMIEEIEEKLFDVKE